MADIQALTEITDGLDRSISEMQRRIPTPDEIQAAVAAGIQQGVRAVITDKEFMATFWEGGYDNLAKHAQTNAQTWIGKRFIQAMSGAVIIGVLIWSVKSGRIS